MYDLSFLALQNQRMLERYGKGYRYMEAVSMGKQKKKSLPWRIVSGLANTALLIVLALFVYLFLAYPVQMKGHSMEPAAAEKSLLLINKVQYCFGAPKQFDVIAFRTKGSDEIQIKRVIACPGDRIRIDEDDIYINGVLCEQAKNYIQDLISAGVASNELTLGEKEYFVLGDHAVYSEDSRSSDIGMVTADQIIGKVWFSGESLLSFRFL